MNENTLSNIQKTEMMGFENIQKIDPVDFSYRDSRAVKMHFQQTFENQRTRDGKYESCHFESCKFRSTGFSGTQFISCRFEDCAIEDSNLQFCGFSKKTKIYGENGGNIISSNLSHSTFVNVELDNVTLKSTTFSQARMINSKLHKVTFDSCTLQDNVFINMVMDDVSLIGCNLEYSDFVNIKFINAKLPFHQIAYTYGLLDTLEEQTEQITVGAKSSGKIVSGQDYLKMLPEFLSYYIKIKDYFPAINILIYLKDYNLAEEYIDLAFQQYIRDNNFRKLREICKLVANHNYYDKHYMASLYFKILEYYNQISLSDYEQHQYSLNINEIKHILTGTQRNLPSAQIVLKTNFSSADIEEVGGLHYIIEKYLIENELSTDDFTIEIRHNSDPLSFWITIIHKKVPVIISAVGGLLTTVSGDPTYFLTAMDILGNAATIGALMLQIYNKENKQKPESNTAALPDNIVSYHKQLKKRKIKISINSAHFNFDYENYRESVH